MRTIRQHRITIKPIDSDGHEFADRSLISSTERNSGTEIGVIQKSTYKRTTESEATGGVFAPRLQKGVTEMPPSSEHAWCSGGHFVHKRAFSMIKGIPDRYCRQCRAEQQAKWRATQKR